MIWVVTKLTFDYIYKNMDCIALCSICIYGLAGEDMKNVLLQTTGIVH